MAYTEVTLNLAETAGQQIAVDQISNIDFQRVKISAGDEGSATDVSTTNPLPAVLKAETTKVIGTVNIAAAQTLATVTTVGAVTAITNALPTGSNVIGKTSIDQTTPGTTNLVALTAETTKVIGTVNIAAAQTLATVTTVGAVTAITNALPTGSNVIGKTSIDQTTPGTTNLVALTAETTKVIGTVNVAASQTIATTQATKTNVHSTAYEASHVLKSSAGLLFMVTGYNSKTTAQWIQLHDATSLPSNTAVPVMTFTVSPQSNFSIDYGTIGGRNFTTGIVVANSTTGPTLTTGASDCFFDGQVI